MNDGAVFPQSEIRLILARQAYARDEVRVAAADLAGLDWLVTTHRGLFGIGSQGARLLIHGWFFGICQYDQYLYLFENCAHRDRATALGRIIRIDLRNGRLDAPQVIARSLHASCHQIAVIDGLLCVVDTAGQVVRRHTLDGAPVDVQQPFELGTPGDTSGAYLHINSIAQVGNRIGLMLHNGAARPERASEIAWLNEAWQVVERESLPGHYCHDIATDDTGLQWHSLSREGAVLRSDGLQIQITRERLTRGIAFSRKVMAIGTSTFGPRHLRGTLNGSVVLLDRISHARLAEIDLPAAPADVIAL